MDALIECTPLFLMIGGLCLLLAIVIHNEREAARDRKCMSDLIDEIIDLKRKEIDDGH